MTDTHKLPVGILGAGNWGTVLALLAAKNQNKVFLFDHESARAAETQQTRENKRYLPDITLPDSIEVLSDLPTVFQNCRLIVPVVPSNVFRQFTRSWASHASGDHLIVHGTKGLEPNTHKRMSEILLEETSCLRVGALSGPNLAPELAAGLPGATVVSSRFDEVIEAAMDAFASNQFRVYGNHDLVGVEWAGSLKNILAIAAGMLNELKYGQNALAMLLTRGLSEISRLIAAMGANPATLLGLAGIGDIIATCSSPVSRNFRAGQMLAQGKNRSEIERELQMTIEGLNTIEVAEALAKRKRLELPIIHSLWQIACEQKPVQSAIEALMERPSFFEFSLH